MLRNLILKEKKITIYNDENIMDNKPMVIYNSFEGDALELWQSCQKLNCKPFILVVIDNLNWDDDMPPWPTPPLFKGEEGSKGLANTHLSFITNELIPVLKEEYNPLFFILAGYSYAGLFTTYAIYQKTCFSRFVCCSSSLWYPNFLDYALKTDINPQPEKIYFSLGDKEKKTNNKIDSVVEENTIKIYEDIRNRGIQTIFELNEGGHFKDVYLRVAKGIKWILE